MANKLNFKIYSAKNVTSEANLYLGKVALSGFKGADNSLFAHQLNTNNTDTFIFSSIIGSKNIKITPISYDGTSINPYLQLDTRWYNFENTSTSGANIFSHYTKNKENVTFFFRALTTDGSLFIKQSKNDKSLWNGSKFIEDNYAFDSSEISIGCSDGIIRVLSPDQQIKDVMVDDVTKAKSASLIKMGSSLNGREINSASNKITMLLKSLYGSQCIKVINKENTIQIAFDDEECPCGIPKASLDNCIISSSSSDGDLYSDSSSSNNP